MLEHDIETAACIHVVCLPTRPGSKAFHRRPAPAINNALQALFLAVRHNQTLTRNSTHQMMELCLDGRKIGEYIGMIEFKIIQYGGARTVMHEL